MGVVHRSENLFAVLPPSMKVFFQYTKGRVHNFCESERLIHEGFTCESCRLCGINYTVYASHSVMFCTVCDVIGWRVCWQ